MNRQRFLSFLLGALCLLLIAHSVLAMSSATYRLDWFTPLTGSGGPASSTNYTVNVTVGQTAIGLSASTSYAGCLGYACSSGASRLYLPLVIRDA